MKSLFKFLLILVWISVINYFSSQVGSESAKTSGMVVTLLNSIGMDVNSIFGSITQFIIRKSAHMIEYFILSILFYIFFKDLVGNPSKSYLSILFAFFVACIDEYHQTFIPMRAGSFIDICIDTSGAIFAMLFILILSRIKNKATFSDKTCK